MTGGKGGGGGGGKQQRGETGTLTGLGSYFYTDNADPSHTVFLQHISSYPFFAPNSSLHEFKDTLVALKFLPILARTGCSETAFCILDSKRQTMILV